MVRAALEFALSESFLDERFVEQARRQRQGELLVSTIVEMMSLVVCQIRPSVHAADQQQAEQIQVAIKSVDNKLNGIEPQVARTLVRETAARLASVVDELEGPAPLLPGYAVRIIDGNLLAATQHRLQPLRTLGSGPLPGQALVVFDPDRRLVTDVFPCEDGHAQERRIAIEAWESVEVGQLWIADRNFCTSVFLWEINHEQAFYLVRQHAQNVTWKPDGQRRRVARLTEQDATVYEQDVRIYDVGGNHMSARRITIRLDAPTRHGEDEIHLLTNLPPDVSADQIAGLYRHRWTIETAFGEMATVLNSEIETLSYPAAALFAFCVGLLSYNVLSLVKSALGSVHGVEKIDRNVSSYYLSTELRCTWKGLQIMLPADYWTGRFATLTTADFAAELTRLAKLVQLRCFQKHPRGPKKKRPKRSSAKRRPHVATARLLAKKRRRT